jgi:hypothetical protein
MKVKRAVPRMGHSQIPKIGVASKKPGLDRRAGNPFLFLNAKTADSFEMPAFFYFKLFSSGRLSCWFY